MGVIQLSGSFGQIFVGYRLVGTFNDWVLIHKSDELNSHTGYGSGTIEFRSETWVGEQPTKISFQLGKVRWSWSNVSVDVIGDKFAFRVEGDPDVR